MPSPSKTARPTRGRPPAADPARRLAWDVLRAVDDRDAYANLLLPALLTQRHLAARDAAFATELAYGALRVAGTLDILLTGAANRPAARIDPTVRDALRLGAYQLLRTRVPARAAVASTVELVRATCGERPVGFANAVMRRLAGRLTPAAGGSVDLAALLDAPPFATDPVGHLAVVTSHPRWIAQAFAAALGGDLDALRAALVADDARPAVHLVARPGRVSRDELLAEVAAAGLAAAPGRYSPYAVALTGGDPSRLPSVVAGRAGVQDEGSQLVTLALAAAPTDGPDIGLTVDLCAGPGGKAALLAGLLPPGAAMVGLEPGASRAGMVAAAGIRAVRADGRRPPLRPGGADRVLVDAPCTGLGALRRRPEARWRRSPDDLAALGPLQRDLLASALELVRPGGVVGYVTCSPHPAETDAVVRSVAGDGRGTAAVEILDARSALPAVDGLGDGPFVRLWPHVHGTDAMFLALLRRRH